MNNKEGFSLIELIIAMAILSFVVVSLFNMLVVTAKTNVASENELNSSIDVQELFEELKGSDNFLGMTADGIEHEYPEDNSILYRVSPVSDYDSNGKHVLYKVQLRKLLNGEVCQNIIGTIIID